MRLFNDIDLEPPLGRHRLGAQVRQMPRPGEPLSVDVLGAGSRTALVESVEEMSYHGIRGLAWRVRVRLPDDTRVDGLRLSDGHLWFADPRVRPA